MCDFIDSQPFSTKVQTLRTVNSSDLTLQYVDWVLEQLPELTEEEINGVIGFLAVAVQTYDNVVLPQNAGRFFEIAQYCSQQGEGNCIILLKTLFTRELCAKTICSNVPEQQMTQLTSQMVKIALEAQLDEELTQDVHETIQSLIQSNFQTQQALMPGFLLLL